ncbi:methionine aminopeptidase 1 [archaeon BMS3Abin17]|nr:methionine aminopeptidase 1 [archaeon BMS3Abin17]HDZ61474.1 type II methionyl aminopeptidase [Candidatus Pacearchaeota archaeon]
MNSYKTKMNKDKIIKAGKIAAEVKKYAKSIIKKGMPLIEIADKIEDKIRELGGKPAFPVSLSINDIAAHNTPLHDDKVLASGLLKIDLGAHIDGWSSDTAFSIDLENSEENKKVIEASEKALENAIEMTKEGVNTSEIGRKISETIESYNLSPIVNLSGHEIKQYDLHAGVTIPNFDNKKDSILKKGVYAIEPFATTGGGKVHDGKPSGSYVLVNSKNVRSQIARDILKFIEEEYDTLPFCSRWIVKKFGVKAIFGLNQLEENGNIHHFAQLVESYNSKVSHAEDTILIDDDGVIVTTKSKSPCVLPHLKRCGLFGL